MQGQAFPVFCTSARRVSARDVRASREFVITRAARVARTRANDEFPLDRNRYNRFAPSTHARDDVASVVALTMTMLDSATRSQLHTSRKNFAIAARFADCDANVLVQNGQHASRERTEFEHARKRERGESARGTRPATRRATRERGDERGDERAARRRGRRTRDRPEGCPRISRRRGARPERARARPPNEAGPGSSPEQIRTAASALRGRRPRPLDDGAGCTPIGRGVRPARWRLAGGLGGEDSNPQRQDQNLLCYRLHHPRRCRQDSDSRHELPYPPGARQPVEPDDPAGRDAK